MIASLQILESLKRHATDAGHRIAVREVGGESGRVITYEDLAERVKVFSRGLAPDETVFLCCPNTIEFYIGFLGSLAADCTVFPFSPDAAEAEMRAAAKLSNASIAVTPASLDKIQRRSIANCKSKNPGALLLQTSGTTGDPAIVRRCASSIDAVCANMIESIRFAPTDQVLATLPLCHSYGLEHGLLAPITAGATVHLLCKFNLAAAVTELRASKITIFPAVPSIFEMLGALCDDTTGFPDLHTAYSAGSVLPQRIVDRCQHKFEIKIGQVYGATEIGSVTYNDPHAANFDSASAGLPMPDVELRITSIAGSEGHLDVRAGSMMSGYVNGDGSEIRSGFFSTGDVARLDSFGRLVITGRTKLLIDIGGLKVNPIEVEQLLLEHPAVSECLVIPVALTETVNRLKALIVPRQRQSPPAADELSRFVRTRLTGYKVPRSFEMRESFPRTPTGKVLRHLVKT